MHIVRSIKMKEIVIHNQKYTLEKNEKEAFRLEEVSDRCTEYFTEFDYILGDYSYDKLRLKGFYDSDNKNVSKINDIAGLEDYILNYCAYGARHFLLKKVK